MFVLVPCQLLLLSDVVVDDSEDQERDVTSTSRVQAALKSRLPMVGLLRLIGNCCVFGDALRILVRLQQPPEEVPVNHRRFWQWPAPHMSESLIPISGDLARQILPSPQCKSSDRTIPAFRVYSSITPAQRRKDLCQVHHLFIFRCLDYKDGILSGGF